MARQAPSQATTREPVRRPDVPASMRAWIFDSRGRDVEVDGEAVAWTSRTVQVRYFEPHERQRFVTAWASAVTRHR